MENILNINAPIQNRNIVKLKYNNHSKLILNENLILDIDSDIIALPSNFFNNGTNILTFNFYNFEIDLNPPVVISNYNLNLKFKVIRFPIYLNICYISEYDFESLAIFKNNVE